MAILRHGRGVTLPAHSSPLTHPHPQASRHRASPLSALHNHH